MIKNIIFVILLIVFIFYVNIVPTGDGRITIKQSVEENGFVETFDIIFSAIGQKITGLIN